MSTSQRRRKKRRYKLTPIGKFVVFGVPIIIIAVIVGIILSNSSKVKDKVILEAGGRFPAVETFLKKNDYSGTFVTDITSIDTTKTGTYSVTIKVGKKEYESKLIIKDTVKPLVTVKSAVSWNGNKVSPEAVVDYIDDITATTVVFVKEPDYSLYDVEQQVTVKVTDAGNNETTVNSTITVIEDKEAPVLLGVCDRTVYIGKAVSYKSNVTVTDDKDSEPVLEIDNSQVDLETEGDYSVIYKATDGAGNSTSQTVTFTVREDDGSSVEPEVVDSLADDVLAGIITQGMSDLEKVKAIYDWVKDNITYTNTSDKGDWTKEAYVALVKRKGDCFTFYAVTQELLTRAGIQNMRIERSTDKITTRHYWNLVNIGDGWYHLDTCPHFRGTSFDSFMKTDEQLKEYTDKYKDNPEVYYYYTFDGDAYPERATTEIN